MSEIVLRSTGVDDPTGRTLTLEQKLFEWSPLGTGATALAIFLILSVLYGLLARLSRWPLIGVGKSGAFLPQNTRDALVLSLLIATALGMQRYARQKDLEEAQRSNSMLAKCFATGFSEIPRSELVRRLAIGTAVGIFIGAAMTVSLNRWTGFEAWISAPAKIWFAFASIVLCMLFTRGVVMTRIGAAGTARFIERDLEIDLLRIDELAPLGKSSARVSLIWFAVSAISCLSLAGGLTLSASIALIVACASIGIGIFVITMEKVHRKIKTAKSAELARLRTQMDSLRHDLHTNAEAALKLQGLIAYEHRIERAPEWPFDQTTAMRLGASALILTLPWFGQAVAQSLVEHIGQFVH
jgi:hypothetical protein